MAWCDYGMVGCICITYWMCHECAAAFIPCRKLYKYIKFPLFPPIVMQRMHRLTTYLTIEMFRCVAWCPALTHTVVSHYECTDCLNYWLNSLKKYRLFHIICTFWFTPYVDYRGWRNPIKSEILILKIIKICGILLSNIFLIAPLPIYASSALVS